MDKQLLGRRIRLVRKEKGHTGEELAELCHISPTYLRQIESGAKIPSLPLFVKLCNALNVSPAYLFADVCRNMEVCDYLNITPMQFFDEAEQYPELVRMAFEELKGFDEDDLLFLITVFRRLKQDKGYGKEKDKR